jgi:hypothetical protein
VEHGARYIYAGVADRFTTAGQAYQLWKHWEEPRALWFAGSHITDWAGEKRAFLETAVGSARVWEVGTDPDNGAVPRTRQASADLSWL